MLSLIWSYFPETSPSTIQFPSPTISLTWPTTHFRCSYYKSSHSRVAVWSLERLQRSFGQPISLRTWGSPGRDISPNRRNSICINRTVPPTGWRETYSCLQAPILTLLVAHTFPMSQHGSSTSVFGIADCSLTRHMAQKAAQPNQHILM